MFLMKEMTLKWKKIVLFLHKAKNKFSIIYSAGNGFYSYICDILHSKYNCAFLVFSYLNILHHVLRVSIMVLLYMLYQQVKHMQFVVLYLLVRLLCLVRAQTFNRHPWVLRMLQENVRCVC